MYGYFIFYLGTKNAYKKCHEIKSTCFYNILSKQIDKPNVAMKYLYLVSMNYSFNLYK